MFTTHQLQKLSYYSDFQSVAQRCSQTNRAAVFLGKARSGGTIMGQWLTQNMQAGSALYYQIGWDGSYSTVMRGLLRRLTAKVPLMTERDDVAQVLIQALQKEECRLIYIDEADRASAEILRELFRVQDLAARANYAFGITLFGHRQTKDWTGASELGAGKIRFSRVIPEMANVEITAILEAWCEGLPDLRGRYDKNDRAVRGGIALIDANGGNRIGVLEDYALMLNSDFRKRQFGTQLIQEIIAHADSPTMHLHPRFEQLDLALSEAA